MIRLIGVKEQVLKCIPDFMLDYINYKSCIVEFCEFHYLQTYSDHVEITVETVEGYKESVSFLYADFYRIEIE